MRFAIGIGAKLYWEDEFNGLLLNGQYSQRVLFDHDQSFQKIFSFILQDEPNRATMKFTFSAVLLLLFNTVFAQKLDVKFDKFTKSKRIETGWIGIKPTMSAPLSVKLRTVGDSAIYIILAGANYGANVIGESSTVTFLFDDESTTEGRSTGMQSYEIGQYSKSYKHQYRLTREQLEMMSKKEVTSIRKSDTDTYADFEIAKKHRDKLTEVAQKLIAELDKK